MNQLDSATTTGDTNVALLELTLVKRSLATGMPVCSHITPAAHHHGIFVE